MCFGGQRGPMIEAIRLESPGQSTHTVGARQQPCSCRRGTRGDKRPHVGLPILQDGEQKSLVGKGSHAMPAANVLWACIQDPNHRAWLSRSHGGAVLMVMGTQRWRPPEPPPARLVSPSPCSHGHGWKQTFGSDCYCSVATCRHLLLHQIQMLQSEACCSFYSIHPWFHLLGQYLESGATVTGRIILLYYCR